MLDGLREYLSAGARFSAGFNPISASELRDFQAAGAFADGLPGSGSNYTYGPYAFNFEAGKPLNAPKMLGKTNATGVSKAMSYGMPFLGLAASTYFIVDGYQQDGIAGAKDAAVYDLATSSAIASQFSPGKVKGTSQLAPRRGFVAGRFLQSNSGFLKGAAKMGGFMRVGMAASLMGGAGQAIAGTPGAFAGAYMGARMGGALPTMAIAGTAIAAAAGAEVVKRGSAVLKAGYMNQRMRRRIDTAGSMASFMTKNAFTERSRAVQAMHRSHLNARSALGSEAGYMHRNTDYFSRYKRF